MDNKVGSGSVGSLSNATISAPKYGSSNIVTKPIAASVVHNATPVNVEVKAYNYDANAVVAKTNASTANVQMDAPTTIMPETMVVKNTQIYGSDVQMEQSAGSNIVTPIVQANPSVTTSDVQLAEAPNVMPETIVVKNTQVAQSNVQLDGSANTVETPIVQANPSVAQSNVQLDGSANTVETPIVQANPSVATSNVQVADTGSAMPETAVAGTVQNLNSDVQLGQPTTVMPETTVSRNPEITNSNVTVTPM